MEAIGQGGGGVSAPKGAWRLTYLYLNIYTKNILFYPQQYS